MKAAIFYFSGTGTTEIAATNIKDSLIQRGYDVSLNKIEDVLKQKATIDVTQYDLIGVGSQVIAFSTPQVVIDFVKKLPMGNGVKTFIFRLAGGVAAVNFNASNKLKSMLKSKGYDVFHERLFSIGSNWITKFDDRVMRGLYGATCSKINDMCDDIISGRSRFLKTGLFQRVLMGFIGFMGRKSMPLIGKDYTVSEACNHCGKCVRDCPAGNIIEKNGRIRFRLSCNCCMRCVYSCPKNAIRLRTFSFFVISGGKYDVRKIVGSGAGEAGLSEVKKPPFFNRYVSDKSF